MVVLGWSGWVPHHGVFEIGSCCVLSSRAMIVAEKVGRWMVLSILCKSLVGMVIGMLIRPLMVLEGSLTKAMHTWWAHGLLLRLLESIRQIVQIF